MKELKVSPKVKAKLKKIKLLLLDVDGVLSDGSILWIKGQGFTRIYHAHDGYGIRHIQRLGMKVGIISGGNSEDLQERIKFLGITHTVLGSEDKLASLNQLAEQTNTPFDQICFIGDDLFDLPALEKVGLAVTVPDGAPEVQKMADLITTIPGGKGAVRQLIDAIRKAQNLK